ncbi:MAG: 2'-5' RNA ligase family protein [Elainellaceae cyanobacterium]
MSFEPNPRFFVALMLSPEAHTFAQQTIRDLKARHQTRTAKAAPHLTLQAPFRWPMADVGMLEMAIASMAETLPPVPIHLSGFGSFPPRVIYINVEKTRALLHVQAQLAQQLQKLPQAPQATELKPERRAFSPHVTVASRNIDRKTFHQIWEELKGEPVEFRYECDRLTLLIYDSSGWSIHSEFQLKG